jgi:Tol biopolymer transport system component
LALILAAVAITLWLGRSRTAQPDVPLTAVPFTSYPGDQSSPTFSPDGNQVAFCWDGEKQDNVDIYVKLVGAGPRLRLTTDSAEDCQPAWSPDGRFIAFLRKLPDNRAAVILTSPLGGAERKLAESSDFLSKPAWSPDSKRLAYVRYRGGVDTLLNALDADRDLFQAQLALSQTRLNEVLSVVQLYKALGGGWQ